MNILFEKNTQDTVEKDLMAEIAKKIKELEGALKALRTGDEFHIPRADMPDTTDQAAATSAILDVIAHEKHLVEKLQQLRQLQQRLKEGDTSCTECGGEIEMCRLLASHATTCLECQEALEREAALRTPAAPVFSF